jgi:choline-sulfatase
MNRPNFLIIFPDQQRYDHIGAYAPGGDTPNVDGLARMGCTFTRAYTSCPLCSPARASMMTGRYPHAVGVPTNTGEAVPGPRQGEVLVSQILTGAGYRCGYSGKWHISRGPIEPWGFADVGGNHNQYHEWCRQAGVHPAAIAEDSPQRFQLTDLYGHVGNYSTPVPARDPCGAGNDYDTFVARQAARMVSNYADCGEPFAVWCCFHGPHPPFVIPEPYYSMYDPARIAPPANFVTPHRRVERWQGAVSPINTHFLDWDWAAWQRSAAVYRGYVRLLDDAIGILLRTLEDKHLLDNTVVIYSSDHGEMLGSHGLWQKSNMYEESAHIPLIVRPPGGCPARTAAPFASLVDMVPTILDYAGLPLPGNLHGLSLRDCIEDRAGQGRPAIFSEWNPHNLRPGSLRMVRTDRYKYVWYPEGDDSLYDLDKDPHELRDLIGEPACREIVSRHRQLLAEWLRDTEDPLASRARVS